MVSEERQRVIEANRSLRLIKNELEALLEKGVLSDDAFDSIQRLLPTESSISGGAATPAQRAAGLPTPSPSSPPVTAMANLNVQPPPGPPSYQQSTGGGGGPPQLPGRNTPAPPPPGKPILAHARALYRYAASDARDCSFERDDRIAVHEYMNNDWWMGRNERTGQEGIFPRNYVELEAAPPPGPPPGQQQLWPPTGQDEKAGYNAYQQQPQYGNGGYPPPGPPPGQGNPYNANVPPMAVADQGSQQNHDQQQGEGSGSKIAEGGKKFGKKLGNAAIFGAGATIGSNIVNSIF